MPPVVAVVGLSNTGKTRVASHLVESLSHKGFRVAAVKHCHHGHDVDRPGSDTDKLRESGASTVIASSPGQVTRMDYTQGDAPLESIVPTISADNDIVIAEGFKNSTVPKILVMDDGGDVPVVDNVIAVVSDSVGEWDHPTYAFEQLELLADQVRRDFLDSERPAESISLLVDGEPVSMKRYPDSALSGIVKGFVSSLKGVPDEPHEITITINIRRD